MAAHPLCGYPSQSPMRGANDLLAQVAFEEGIRLVAPTASSALAWEVGDCGDEGRRIVSRHSVGGDEIAVRNQPPMRGTDQTYALADLWWWVRADTIWPGTPPSTEEQVNVWFSRHNELRSSFRALQPSSIVVDSVGIVPAERFTSSLDDQFVAYALQLPECHCIVLRESTLTAPPLGFMADWIGHRGRRV